MTEEKQKKLTFHIYVGGGENDFTFKRFPHEVRDELRNLAVGEFWFNPEDETGIQRVD